MAGKEFLEQLPTMNIEELDNSFKCLGILYLQLDTYSMDFVQTINAPRLLEMLAKKKLEREFQLLANNS